MPSTSTLQDGMRMFYYTVYSIAAASMLLVSAQAQLAPMKIINRHK